MVSCFNWYFSWVDHGLLCLFSMRRAGTAVDHSVDSHILDGYSRMMYVGERQKKHKKKSLLIALNGHYLTQTFKKLLTATCSHVYVS